MVAIEDPVQAGEYERRLKGRPSPFVTRLKLSDSGVGSVQVGINIPSLLHRAVTRLPSKDRTGAVVLSWRLDTNFTPAANLNLPKFKISSNKTDREHEQPPNFIISLRKEQLRSLGWMIRQESRDAAPFIEEEISEAVLDPLGWRAEGRAQRPVLIRGGVLADQVGYGKTAITLGLIDCTSKLVKKEFAKLDRMPGKIPVKGTLIIVPPHLTKQWHSEVKKFTGSHFKVLVITTVSNLNSAKIEDVQDADIIVVASNIFKSNVYLENLQLLAGAGELPAKDGRHFSAQLQQTLSGLKNQVDLLQDESSLAVLNEIKASQKRCTDSSQSIPIFTQTFLVEEAATAQVASKRLKGKSYRDAAEALKSEEKHDLGKLDKPHKKTVEASSAITKDGPTAKRTPSGLIPEVVIVTSKSSTKSDRSSVPSPTDKGSVDSDDTGMAKRQKRASAKRPIVISDDESSEGPETLARSKKLSSSKPAKKRRLMKRESSPSSDYQGGSSDERESDFEMVSDDSGEDSKPQNGKKAKTISKPKPSAPKKSAKAKAQTSEDDQMEVDEPDNKKEQKKAGKRKATDDKDKPKRAKRTDSDPWKLGSRAVQNEWTYMQAPPFEMFHFARVVVDEYTYLDGKVHALVTNLSADRQWVLSGTPPIHDFGALKTISAFLNIHLGIDDEGEGRSAEVKKRTREQTGMAYNYLKCLFIDTFYQLLSASTRFAKSTRWNGILTAMASVSPF